MKKKREAKRQAKQQEVEDSNDTTQKTDEPVDNEKQLRIKKIQSVCFYFYFLLFFCIFFFVIHNLLCFIMYEQFRLDFILQDLKSINRLKTLQSSGKELDNNQTARLKLENGLLAELKQLQL